MDEFSEIKKRLSKKTYLSAQERIEELLESENIIPERPPSLDAKGHRLDIFPAAVRGRFRKYRTTCYLFLVFVFLILPWTRFSGQQTVHLNLSKMQFIFFGKTLFAHDVPYLFLFFGSLSWLVYGYYLNDLPILTTNTLTTISTFIILFLIFKERKNTYN